MSDFSSDAGDAAWAQMRPLLDEAVGQLGDNERDAVVLRFFEDLNYREVGEALGVSEDGARMRVERALDKLRAHFSRQGVTTTVALLAGVLGAHGAVGPAPTGFAATVAERTLAAGLRHAPKFSIPAFAGSAVVAMLLLLYLVLRHHPAQTSSPPAQTTPVPKAVVAPTTPPAAVAANATESAISSQTRALPPPKVIPPPPPPPLPAQIFTQQPAQATFAPQPLAQSTPLPNPTAPASLVAANNKFAFDAFHRASAQADENAFFSPYSISTAMALAWSASAGNTAAQIAAALHFSDLPADQLVPAFAALQQDVARAQSLSGAQLALANGLWPAKNAAHPPLQAKFNATVTPADFANADDDALLINAWASDKTGGKIKNLVSSDDLDARTRMVLASAIYFKGNWVTQFIASRDANADFHLPDGSTAPSVLMNNTVQARYADLADAPAPCQLLALTFYATQRPALGASGQGVSMIIVLPRDTAALGDVEKSLTPDTLNAWIGRLAAQRVNLFLPKFEIAERYSLNDNFKAMGVTDAFDPGLANFMNLDGAKDLSLGDVAHAAMLEVNEYGAGASAAPATQGFGAGGTGGASRGFGGPGGGSPGTGGVPRGGRGGGAPQPAAIFRADHPFLFFIRDDITGSILFIGRLAKPAPMQMPPPGARGTRNAARGTTVQTTAPASTQG